MQQAPAKKGINLNLEALRGFAALFVVLNHIEALHSAFNPDYLPTATIVLAPNGRLFVLVFFVLSGYVIGLNHNKPLQGKAVGSYIRKRLLRIYPIYLVSLIFTLIIAQNSYPVWMIAANLLMLQVLVAPPFVENGPAWSLHYEMVYYGLYILISRIKQSLLLLIVVSVVIALGGAGIFSSYFLGLAFWLSGVYIAQTFKQDKLQTNYGRLAAAIFLLLAFDQLLARPGISSIIDHLTYRFPGRHYLDGLHVSPLISEGRDLIYLPIYAFIVILFSGKKWRYEGVSFLVLNIILIGAILLTVKAYTNGYTAHIKVYLISIIYYAIALLLWFINWSGFNNFGKKFMALGAWLGGISYALYMIHAPAIYLIGRITLSASKEFNYVLKLLVLVAIIIPLSWLLEKRLQPYLRKTILGSQTKMGVNTADR